MLPLEQIDTFLSKLLIFRIQPIPHMPLFFVRTFFLQGVTVFYLIALTLKFEYFLITTCMSYKTDNYINNYSALLLTADVICCDLYMMF